MRMMRSLRWVVELIATAFYACLTFPRMDGWVYINRWPGDK